MNDSINERDYANPVDIHRKYIQTKQVGIYTNGKISLTIIIRIDNFNTLILT